MNIWKLPLTAATAFLISVCVLGEAAAQDPFAEYNRARAYRHFLTSPYRTRTFSSLTPGYSWGYSTPFADARYWRTPGYWHERISPRGHEQYVVPQREGGYVIPRPMYVPPTYPYSYPYSYPTRPW